MIETKPTDDIPIKVSKLNFTYANTFGSSYDTIKKEKILTDITLSIGFGQRCIVCGGNGAGKSTFLRILAGKHLPLDDTVLILGKDSFRDPQINRHRAYVSLEWGQHSVAFTSYGTAAYSADIKVSEMMIKLQNSYPERRDKILKVLRINPEWKMHRLSDGQRRRVQLFLELIRPSKLIILDEVLGVLDIVSRQDLLYYLKQESELYGVTIVFATHIFDGMDDWATHLIYLKSNGGKLGFYGLLHQIPDYIKLKNQGVSGPVMRMIELWLREELKDELNEKEDDYTDNPLNNAQKSAGGYAPGRFAGYTLEELTAT